MRLGGLFSQPEDKQEPGPVCSSTSRALSPQMLEGRTLEQEGVFGREAELGWRGNRGHGDPPGHQAAVLWHCHSEHNSHVSEAGPAGVLGGRGRAGWPPRES